MRLAVAPVEPCEGPEQAGVSLRRQDGVELGERGGIETGVGRPASLDVAGEQRQFQLLGHVDSRVLQQRHQVIGSRPQYSVLEVDDADTQYADAVAEPD